MGEAMTGLKRSHMCCDVSENLIGSEVTVMGWVQRRRDLGQLIILPSGTEQELYRLL